MITAVSGTSGAGKSLKPHLLGSEVMGSLSAYGVGGVHRHTPEIVQNLSAAAGAPVAVSFTPVLAPLPRGILATCSAPLTERRRPTRREAYAKAYADEPFVHLLPEGSWPTTAATLGANTVASAGHRRPDAGRLVVVAAIDNLTKGTAGGADPVHEPRARPAGDHRPADRRGSRRERHRAARASGPPGVAAGIKASGKPDLALVVNDGPRFDAAGVFTRNKVKAAPVLWTEQVLATGRLRAVVLNSGGANACTGPRGLPDHARHRGEGRRAARRAARRGRRSAPPG